MSTRDEIDRALDDLTAEGSLDAHQAPMTTPLVDLDEADRGELLVECWSYITAAVERDRSPRRAAEGADLLRRISDALAWHKFQ